MSRRARARWQATAMAVVVLGGTLAAGCGGPGSGNAQTATPTSLSAPPTCGTAPVTINGYFETGFPMPKALTTEFSNQFQNVKWNIREDQFAVITQNAPRVLADDPPDLMRLPQVSELVKDGLSNQRISKELFLSQATVKSHLMHIYAKLGVDSRTSAVAVR